MMDLHHCFDLNSKLARALTEGIFEHVILMASLYDIELLITAGDKYAEAYYLFMQDSKIVAKKRTGEIILTPNE